MARIPRLTPTQPRVRLLAGVLIGAWLSGAVAWLRDWGPIRDVEAAVVDARTKHYVGATRGDPRIVTAVVKSEDVEDMKVDGYPWPWPLMLNEFAFDWMAEAGVKAVLVDVLQFDYGSSPEELGATPDRIAALRAEGKEADAESMARVAEVAARQRDEAAALAATYLRIGGVVLGVDLADASDLQPESAVAQRTPVLAEHLSRLPRLGTTASTRRHHVNLPIVTLMRGAGGVGFVNVDPDPDAKTRRALLVGSAGGRLLVSLPLRTAMAASGGTVSLEPDRIVLGSSTQRVGEDGTFLVNFRGGDAAYVRVRPSDMVRAGSELEEWRAGGKKGPLPSHQSALPEKVRGKVVVWGVDIGGIKDVVPTPLGGRFSGPVFQATVLDNLLNGDGRVPVSRTTNTILIVVLGALFGFLGGFSWPLKAYLGIVFGGAAVLVFVGYRLFASGIVIDLFAPILGMTLAYLGVLAFRLSTEGIRNRWLEGTFGKYLSPSVIEALKEDPNLIQLGGKRVEVTVLFSDVKGFTSISEKLKPEDLVRLLNRYLTRQSAEVLAEEGVIDKFIGDAVMAFFGEPIPHSDHALRACRAAVRCVEALADMEPLTKELNLPPLSNRIGVNSGPALVGNMGSDARFDYTVMGDTVNLASRLEGANKAFGSRILIGPGTYEQAKDGIVAKPLPRVVVVGKALPMQIYQLVGLKGEVPDDVVRHVDAYGRAHAALLADDLEGGAAALAEAEREKPKDATASWLRGILVGLRDGSIRRPWDGVFVLESK